MSAVNFNEIMICAGLFILIDIRFLKKNSSKLKCLDFMKTIPCQLNLDLKYTLPCVFIEKNVHGTIWITFNLK